MKKTRSLLAYMLLLLFFLTTTSGCGEVPSDDGAIRVAMISDVSDITDKSFNQTTYAACREYCQEHRIKFRYYKPIDDNDESRTACVHMAISNGYNVIFMPGYTFASTLVGVAEQNPDICFVTVDSTEYDLCAAALGVEAANRGERWELPKNVFSAIYREEQSGFLAGYAAVQEGYRRLGFVGGMALPAVIRFGYGYLQGINQAAVELGVASEVSVKYVYAGQFYGDADITATMDTWCADNDTEVIFACGGDLYVSAAEVAAKSGIDTRVIGVDSDQSALINQYEDALCLTSATKDLSSTVRHVLASFTNGEWEQTYAGRILRLGIVSDNPRENFVSLPLESWAMKNFSKEAYAELVHKLRVEEITVSEETSVLPDNLQIEVIPQAQIK